LESSKKQMRWIYHLSSQVWLQWMENSKANCIFLSLTSSGFAKTKISKKAFHFVFSVRRFSEKVSDVYAVSTDFFGHRFWAAKSLRLLDSKKLNSLVILGLSGFFGLFWGQAGDRNRKGNKANLSCSHLWNFSKKKSAFLPSIDRITRIIIILVVLESFRWLGGFVLHWPFGKKKSITTTQSILNFLGAPKGGTAILNFLSISGENVPEAFGCGILRATVLIGSHRGSLAEILFRFLFDDLFNTFWFPRFLSWTRGRLLIHGKFQDFLGNRGDCQVNPLSRICLLNR